MSLNQILWFDGISEKCVCDLKLKLNTLVRKISCVLEKFPLTLNSSTVKLWMFLWEYRQNYPSQVDI